MAMLVTIEAMRRRLHRALEESFKPRTCPFCDNDVTAGFEAHTGEPCRFVCPECGHTWTVELPDE